jgi:long-chain acyl-CoA synthetase
MMVQDFLRRSAHSYPDKIALELDRQQWTYAQLETATTRLASSMLEFGISPGDRAIILLENSCEVVLSIFALLKSRAVFIVLNPQMPVRKLRYIIKDSGAALLITDEAKLAKARQALSDSHTVQNILLCRSTDLPIDETAPANVTPPVYLFENACSTGADTLHQSTSEGTSIDLAAIIYTSGSTGVPKGVVAAHLNMISAVESINAYLRNTSDDVVLNVLPLSFDYGLYQIFLMFACGGTLVLQKKFGYPFSLIEKLKASDITGFPLVPTIGAAFARLNPLESPPTLPALRYLTNTGDVLSITYIQHLQKLFPKAHLFSMYGLTECKRVSYLPPSEIDNRPDSVGIPMPNCEVAIIGDDGQPVTCGQVGELVVRGPNVMQGYWNSPEETRRVFRKGTFRMDARLYTGDLFRMDKEGYLYFVSRKDDLLKIRGERVSPKEIENVLNEIGEVAEAAIVAVKDQYDQKYMVAMVAALPGKVITANDILRHCGKRLEPHLIPKKVRILKYLPKNENGKINRSALCTN